MDNQIPSPQEIFSKLRLAETRLENICFEQLCAVLKKEYTFCPRVRLNALNKIFETDSFLQYLKFSDAYSISCDFSKDIVPVIKNPYRCFFHLNVIKDKFALVGYDLRKIYIKDGYLKCELQELAPPDYPDNEKITTAKLDKKSHFFKRIKSHFKI